MSDKRLYETTFIVNAALEDQDIDAVVSKVTGYIENHGGEIKTLDRWGRRRLAYPINKKFNGYYVHGSFVLLPENLNIIDRFMVLEDSILRHLNTILDDKLIDLRKQRALEKGDASEEEEKKDKKGGRR
ncbi:30S ribosomal protein S6 [Candidatus Kapabacteria bacterium]|nr:30S ribosomal protein S6 [Candidatus Kapabacteria bacterium]